MPASNPARAVDNQTSLKVPAFSNAERDRRWNLGRHLMEAEGLEALIVYGDREGSNPAPFAPDTYFTNERPGAIVVFPREGEPISIAAFPMAAIDHMQARERKEAVWIRPENFFAGKKGEAVVAILKKLRLEKALIGVVGLEPYPPFYFDGAMPYNTWKTVIDALPQATFKPVQMRFIQMTSVRSAEELEVLKWSAQVGEEMCVAMREAARPGATEGDIYSAVLEACPRNAAFTGELLLGSGPEYNAWGLPTWAYRPRAPRTVREGDAVLAEVFCSVGMLETQHQPTVAIGKMHPDFDRAEKVAREAYEIGLKKLRPGVPFGEVAEAMDEPVRRAGGWHVHPWIHSMNPFGLISGLPGLDKLPQAAGYGRVGAVPLIGGEALLQAGMTFAFEPNCAFGKHVANLGGTVVVGENGAIELNHVATRVMRV